MYVAVDFVLMPFDDGYMCIDTDLVWLKLLL